MTVRMRRCITDRISTSGRKSRYRTTNLNGIAVIRLGTASCFCPDSIMFTVSCSHGEAEMKIALCTTTIHVPHALKLMRKCSADVRFFIACDKKTPDKNEMPETTNTVYFWPSSQEKWKCSEAIGWNTLSRRNIAFLEALKWGADVIYSWDNDNLPADLDHFTHFERWWSSGINIASETGWFDPGSLLIPATRHRGFPHNKPVSKMASPVIDAPIGVAAGLVIGDPDIDAVTRMEHSADIGSVQIL